MRPDAASGLVLTNVEVAQHLEKVADLLEQQRANQYRVMAWRTGAATIRGLERPVADIVRHEGIAGLDALPGIGPSLARAIREIVETGSLATLNRLGGGSDPVASLASVPGVGDVLAHRIRDALAIDSLEELEAAAHDGRLAAIPGFGVKRIKGIRDSLATRLAARRRTGGSAESQPDVAELLDVDREYREKADARELPTITPRRFNPARESWLSVLHATRGTRHYTALFSNTALAHQLKRTRDWVVLYFDGRDGEHQCTVVTALRGRLQGRRIVRGRERECEAHYGIAGDERPASPIRRNRNAKQTTALRG